MSQAGAEGNVDQAQHMMKDVEFFRQEREKLKNAKVEEPQRKVFLVSVVMVTTRFTSPFPIML